MQERLGIVVPHFMSLLLQPLYRIRGWIPLVHNSPSVVEPHSLRSAAVIDIGHFFEYLQWPRNTFANHLFDFMESADEDGGVDFGDFVKVLVPLPFFFVRFTTSLSVY